MIKTERLRWKFYNRLEKIQSRSARGANFGRCLSFSRNSFWVRDNLCRSCW